MLRQVRIGHARVSVGDRQAIVSEVWRLVGLAATSVVVTPNIHHLAVLNDNLAFRVAYRAASCWPADGWPVAALSTVKARARVERVPGSDLVGLLCERAAVEGVPVALLGGSGPATVTLAKERLEAAYPGLKVSYCDPLLDLDLDDISRADRLNENLGLAGARVVFLGVGAPKQEIFATARLAPRIDCGVILCVGAGIDFVAGVRPRASGWIRLVGLEWAHRVIQEPRRLAPRYIASAGAFIHIVTHELYASVRRLRQ